MHLLKSRCTRRNTRHPTSRRQSEMLGLTLTWSMVGQRPALQFRVQQNLHTKPVLKWSATSLYTGGADTTVSSLMTFFLAMALFPDVQRKAQEEIDRVIGNDRLPVSADKDSLPYIWATVKETHRWYPVVPMAIPHCASEEDTIRGYRIPKGSVLIPNTWYVRTSRRQ